MIFHSALSRGDLISIYFYNLATYHEAHAELFISFLNGEIEKLGHDPYLGRAVDEFEGLLTFLVQPKPNKGGYGYRVFYRPCKNGIEILRVLHTSRDWQYELQREEL